MQHIIYLMCVSMVTQLLVVSKAYPAFTGGRTDISHLWKSTLYGQITNTHFSDTWEAEVWLCNMWLWVSILWGVFFSCVDLGTGNAHSMHTQSM